MSLTTGGGPLSREPFGRFSVAMPAGAIYVEPYPRRIRAMIAGRTVIDSEEAKLVHRAGLPTSYAFPGDAVPGELAEPEPAVEGYVSVPWGRVDAWYEEEVHLADQSYPKNPYHRVDCLASTRRLRVELDGVILVDSATTLAVFETALAPRLYVAKQAARTDLFTPSPATSWCSYKGRASWWNVTVDGVVISDVAWSYEHPLAEFTAGAGLLSFDERRCTVRAALPSAGE